MSGKTTSKPKPTTKGKKTSHLSSDSNHVSNSTSSTTRTNDMMLSSRLSNTKTKSHGTICLDEQTHHLSGLCVQPVNSDSKQHEYYHTHADRLTAVWAWLDNQMHTRVFQPRHIILFEFAAQFIRFCATNHDLYRIKDDNQLKHIHVLTFEEAAIVLHEHLSFHYQTLRCFMKNSESYVEYIKQLRNACTLDDVKNVKVRHPQNCVFDTLEKHWDASERQRLIKQHWMNFLYF